ncbi:MAG: nuclear transport factor 2 family protein [Phycisphaerales bacterium]|nr:nuclear transport factor 2 family protein [Hyphomonadaceae bacterium]
MTLQNLNPKAAASLAHWHAMVERGELTDLASIVHPQATFRSPMAFKPYHSAEAATLLLRTVMTVFEDFTYHRQAASADGQSVVLEFSARVGERSLKGVDLIAFDEDGLIIDFEVMIRPMNSLQALGAAMGERLSAVLPQFKEKA